MIVGIVDIETTGLSITDDHITEVSAIVFSTESDRIIHSFSSIINDTEFIPHNVVQMTGITARLCKEYGTPLLETMESLKLFLSMCDYAIAHNGSTFDWPMILRHTTLTVPLLDSKTDIKWPTYYSSKRLIHLVAESGCQVHGAHSALNDCLMLLEVLKKRDAWQDMADIVAHRENKVPCV